MDCKSIGTAFGGSNPPPSTNKRADGDDWLVSRESVELVPLGKRWGFDSLSAHQKGCQCASEMGYFSFLDVQNRLNLKPSRFLALALSFG